MKAVMANCGDDGVRASVAFPSFLSRALSMQTKHSTTKPQSSPDFLYLFKILKHDHNSDMKMFFPNYLLGEKKAIRK